MGPVDVEQLIEDVSYTSEAVADAAETQPRLYLEAARYHSQKFHRMNKLKSSMKELEASREMKIREELAQNSGGERVTEGKVATALTLDREVIRARRAFAKAETFELYTRLMCEAYKMRRDGIAHAINLQTSELRQQRSLEGSSQVEKVKEKLRKKYPREE